MQAKGVRVLFRISGQDFCPEKDARPKPPVVVTPPPVTVNDFTLNEWRAAAMARETQAALGRPIRGLSALAAWCRRSGR